MSLKVRLVSGPGIYLVLLALKLMPLATGPAVPKLQNHFRAHALVGEDFQQHGMRHPSVHK